MSKFKVGDKIKVIGITDPSMANWKVGDTGTWQSRTLANMDKQIHDLSMVPVHYELIKIGDSKMNKYDELKGRIETNRGMELGWGRDFDNILQEITSTEDIYKGHSSIRLCVRSNERPTISIFHSSNPHISVASFGYCGQCDKNRALHQAALWLLDHSDIKKDEKADKIKALQAQMDELQAQIKEIS